MALTKTPVCKFNQAAPKFSLKGTDNKIHTLDSCKGSNGILVMFICNHCPYVQAIQKRLIEDVKKLQDNGIGCVAIMSNDTENYPADSFENMQRIATNLSFSFPYLLDDTQNIAREYEAVCTPDFFGYNSSLKLQYRGRLDSAESKEFTDKDTKDLLDAMLEIAKTGNGPEHQIPSIGCSIKWR